MTPSSVPPIDFVRLPSAAELEAIVGELYAAHHVLRAFGLMPDDLYVGVLEVSNVTPPGHHALVQVRKNGKEAILALVKVEPEWAEPILTAWQRFVGELQTIDVRRLDAMVSRSKVRARAAEVAAMLAMRGLLAGATSPGELN